MTTAMAVTRILRPGLLRLTALGLASGVWAGCGTPPAEAPSQPPPAPAASPDSISLDYPRWETMEPGDRLSYNRRASLVQRGREVYDRYCVGCHGVYGDGHGPAAVRLITKPRDFTRGIFKFRSTDSSSLPMESDLYRTITRGLAGVSMPAFPLMPHRDKLAVIEYIKSFYPRWELEKQRRTLVPVPRAPQDLDDERRLLRGRIVYLEMQCYQCHGYDGQGTGAARRDFDDTWGNTQRAFNFTRGSLKGGDAPEDIFRTFHTGLISIMPSYGGLALGGITQTAFQARRGTIPDDEFERLLTAITDFPAGNAELTAMDPADQQELANRNSWDLVAHLLSLRESGDRSSTTARAVLGVQ